jgi:hypothetical protein
MQSDGTKKSAATDGAGNFRDIQIRRELRRILLTEHESAPDTLVVEEFGCHEARADAAVINGRMHCYEIKSSFDRLDRLTNQITAYSAVFDLVTLVVAKAHLHKARKMIPRWWGITEVVEKDKKISLRRRRGERQNPQLSSKALSRMLWRDEAYSLLQSLAIHDGLRKAPVQKIWQAIEDGLPTELISKAVREAIKQRGGSGFRQPLLQNDDSSPMQSSFRHYQATLKD